MSVIFIGNKSIDLNNFDSFEMRSERKFVFFGPLEHYILFKRNTKVAYSSDEEVYFDDEEKMNKACNILLENLKILDMRKK